MEKSKNENLTQNYSNDIDSNYMNPNYYYSMYRNCPMYNYYYMKQFCSFCPLKQIYAENNYERMVNPPFHGKPPFPGKPPVPNKPNNPNANKAPKSPPPSFTPHKPSGKGVKAVDTGSIKPCLYRYTYIWQTNGNSYWAFLTYVGKNSISGWRWLRFRWVYFGLDLKKIAYFHCT